MCDPVSATIAAVSAAASIGGSMMSANAQKQAANAIQQQNWETEQAQNQGFMARMQAANVQTGQQRQVMEQTMAARNQAFSQMRDAQNTALQDQQTVLAAENAQEAKLQATGDTAAQTMLDQTNAANLAASQKTAQDQAAALLASAVPSITDTGPQATDPTAAPDSGSEAGSDASSKAAMAARVAQAAGNIRDYGAKVANVASYSQPGEAINLAIAGNKYGIMPAQTAEDLLKQGSSVRLLPSQLEWSDAGATGQALDAMIQSQGQSGLDEASLTYGNTANIADLQQGNLTTIAANTARQKEADAAYQQSLGNIVSGVGNLGLYGAGYYGGNPFAKKTA